MKILLIDHEDSFVHNIEQALASLGARVVCLRSTEPWKVARTVDPDGVVLSPGPGSPSDRRVTGLSRRLLRAWDRERPFLGICLGHQLIGSVYGASVIRARRPVHGEIDSIRHDGGPPFADVASPFVAARYHSLVIDPATLPRDLEASAFGTADHLMGIRHRQRPVFGLQFHPESYLTPAGPQILQNFLREVRR